MNYELALELKKAGFPIIERANESGRVKNYIQENVDEPVFIPTLSELIDAIGDRFLWLKRHREEDWKLGRWYAEAYAGGYCHFCDTPEEAVARLWLALQKK